MAKCAVAWLRRSYDAERASAAEMMLCASPGALPVVDDEGRMSRRKEADGKLLARCLLTLIGARWPPRPAVAGYIGGCYGVFNQYQRAL